MRNAPGRGRSIPFNVPAPASVRKLQIGIIDSDPYALSINLLLVDTNISNPGQLFQFRKIPTKRELLGRTAADAACAVICRRRVWINAGVF
jgi:hypothetical protein